MRSQVIHIACLFALSVSVILPSMGQEIVFKSTQHFFEVEGQAGYKYHWSIKSIETGEITLLPGTGAVSDNILFDKDGQFVITVQPEDTEQCLGEKVSMDVEVKTNTGLLANAGPDITIGACQAVQLNATNSLGSNVTCTWTPADYLDDPNSMTPTFTPGETTKLVMTATDQYGMSGTDTIQVIVVPLPQADLRTDYEIDPWEELELDASACDEGNCFNYAWVTVDGDIVAGQDAAKAKVVAPGTYELTLTDNFGCQSTQYAYVEERPWNFLANDDRAETRRNAPVDINVLENEEVSNREIDTTSLVIVRHPYNGNVTIDHQSGLISYSPKRHYTGPDDFSYQISDKLAGNRSEAEVTVDVKELEIPQAFSPNGDGTNDYFQIEGIDSYPNADFMVYNRWGSKVYKKKNYQDDWDGTSNTGVVIGNSGVLPEGTYFYILDLNNGDKQEKGTVYLTR